MVCLKFLRCSFEPKRGRKYRDTFSLTIWSVEAWPKSSFNNHFSSVKRHNSSHHLGGKYWRLMLIRRGNFPHLICNPVPGLSSTINYDTKFAIMLLKIVLCVAEPWKMSNEIWINGERNWLKKYLKGQCNKRSMSNEVLRGWAIDLTKNRVWVPHFWNHSFICYNFYFVFPVDDKPAFFMFCTLDRTLFIR